MKHNKFSENYIEVYLVESDAFTIHEDDLTRMMGFYITISDWNIEL